MVGLRDLAYMVPVNRIYMGAPRITKLFAVQVPAPLSCYLKLNSDHRNRDP